MSSADSLATYVPPAEGPPLDFQVFLSSRMNCPHLRDRAHVTIDDLEKSFLLQGLVRLTVNRCESASMGCSGSAQDDIESQLPVPIEQFQLVIGFAEYTLGPRTRLELLKAVTSAPPRPFVLFFLPSESPRFDSRDDGTLRQWLELVEFRRELEGMHDAVCHGYRDEEDFGLQLRSHLSKYIERHLRVRNLTRSPRPEPPRPLPPPEQSPYPGIRAMGPADGGRFCGREDDIEALLKLVRAGQRVICIRGPSGSGKSSLLMAGLLPRILEGGAPPPESMIVNLDDAQGADGRIDPFHAVARRAPGIAPSDVPRLAERLAASDDGLRERLRSLGAAPDDRHVVLVLDQAEYLLSRTAPALAGAFARSVRRSVDAGTVTVLCTLRDDGDRALFESTELEDLRELTNGAIYNLGPLKRQGLVRAIRTPAVDAGYTVDPDLLERLAEDADRERGSLPLLAAALADMHARWYDAWQSAPGNSKPPRRFTLTLYPGFKDVIDRLADRALALASPDEQQALPSLYWRMVRFDPITQAAYPVRVDRHAVESDPRLRSLTERLARARLLVSGAEGIEFAHSRVLDLWTQLADWIERSRTDLEELAYLELRKERWSRSGVHGDLLSWDDVRKAEELVHRVGSFLGRSHPTIQALEPLIVESRRINGLLEGLRTVDFDLLQATRHHVVLSEAECGAQWPFYKALKGFETNIEEDDWSKVANRGMRLVHFAAFGNNVAVLERAMAIGQSLTVASEKGHTPVHLAVFGGAVHALDLLDRAGCDVNQRASDGWTPLAIAAARGATEIVDVLLACGAAPGGHGHPGEVPPLVGAALQDRAGIADRLLRAGAAIDARHHRGRMALHVAADLDHLAVVERLLQASHDLTVRDGDGRTPVHHAAHDGALRTLALLVGRGDTDLRQHTDRQGATPLHTAAQRNSHQAVEILLAHDPGLADVHDHYGETPLHDAARYGSVQALTRLCEALGHDLCAPPGRTIAPRQGQQAVPGRTALHVAVEASRIDCCTALLEIDPALIDAVDGRGCTPVQLAAAVGSLDILQLLAQRGADIGARTGAGETPLHLAASAGEAKACAWLLAQRPASIALREMRSDGGTPLHAAAAGRKDEAPRVVALLLENGADPNASRSDGATPLHLAVAFGHKESLYPLWKGGADPLRRNVEERTPLDLAMTGQFTQEASFLAWVTRETAGGPGRVVPSIAGIDAAREPVVRAIAGMPGVEAAVPWLAHPKLHAPWEPFQGTALVDALAALEASQRSSGSETSLSSCRLLGARRVPLPHYPGYSLIELSLEALADGEGRLLAFLYGPGVAHRLPGSAPLLVLDGSSRPLHELNCHLPIALENEEMASAYLRFFCGYLAAESEPSTGPSSFLIIDSLDALRLPDERSRGVWAGVLREIRSLTVKGADDERFEFQATVLYARRLFQTTLRVWRWGWVTMEDDTPISMNPLPTAHDRWRDVYRLV